ncbi:MAG: Fe-S cluster assembly protein SufD [Candidatus Omnitrophica bacterium]|nr:Fe-S cluster assembly protein SufD [Candidatus Omnitrophota bacterium]
MFDTAAIDQLAKALKEPPGITDLRRKALARHTELPWPHPSDDVWRRIDVSLLDPSQGFSPTPPSLLPSVQLTDAQLALFTKPLGDEQLLARINGHWLREPVVPGIAVSERIPQAVLEASGLTEAEEKLASLNTAFHDDDVSLEVSARTSLAQPLRLVRLIAVAPQQAIFPLTAIRVGEGSSVTIIDEYVSAGTVPMGTVPHLVNGRIELILEENASVRYVRLQRWDQQAREFVLQRATLAAGASLTLANISLGASVSKTHVITRLAGETACAKLYGFVFGQGVQHIDQHTLQDHQAPHTESDLQYRAALQDQSHMVYTGLIRIAPTAQQTNAYQANHNLMLSQRARAETIPMLEILADDVQCKHGASTGPIDDEQAFYLMSRGVPREAAQRLIVMGFIEPIMQQIPFAPLRERLRQEIEGNLQHG